LHEWPRHKGPIFFGGAILRDLSGGCEDFEFWFCELTFQLQRYGVVVVTHAESAHR
jgi:hypothetical protein